jgi:hypothetical protein
MSNKGYPSVACSNPNIANSISRFLKYNFGFKEILINPLKDPFKYKESIEIAEQSEFLIIDAFINGEPKGFHFAKQMEKKTLLLFYTGELDIEDEDSFWIVLPNKLGRLQEKIIELIKESTLTDSNYIELENRFSILRATKGHHE